MKKEEGIQQQRLQQMKKEEVNNLQRLQHTQTQFEQHRTDK